MLSRRLPHQTRYGTISADIGGDVAQWPHIGCDVASHRPTWADVVQEASTSGTIWNNIGRHRRRCCAVATHRLRCGIGCAVATHRLRSGYTSADIVRKSSTSGQIWTNIGRHWLMMGRRPPSGAMWSHIGRHRLMLFWDESCYWGFGFLFGCQSSCWDAIFLMSLLSGAGVPVGFLTSLLGFSFLVGTTISS